MPISLNVQCITYTTVTREKGRRFKNFKIVPCVLVFSTVKISDLILTVLSAQENRVDQRLYFKVAKLVLRAQSPTYFNVLCKIILGQFHVDVKCSRQRRKCLEFKLLL